MNNKKLYRTEDNKMIAGVCGGIAEYLNIDPTLIRVFWVIISLSSIGVILYIAMAIIVPVKSQVISGNISSDNKDKENKDKDNK